MSRDDIAVAQASFDAWPDDYTPPDGLRTSDAGLRLRTAIKGLTDGSAGWRDVGGLVRQVLLTTDVTYHGKPSLTVPDGGLWPDAESWEQLHCRTVRVSEDRLVVQAVDWEPSSDPVNDVEAQDLARQQVRAVYRDVEARQSYTIKADPFWKAAHNYATYRGEPQRQAARAAVLNESGSLLLSLPTGRGKTAIAWSKVLLTAHGVTVVIVPTVVLALDMEQRTRDLASDRGLNLSPTGKYAYIGSLDPSIKNQLRDAVQSGVQRILYTSPEAFVSSLAPSVLACARAGNLQQIVIDEAHLVDQWGSDFRSEFQTMPGLIKDAYRQAPEDSRPSVLLMSATLAQQSVDLLSQLFRFSSDEVDLVWGSEMRTEPAYFFAEFPEDDARNSAVLEAVSCLPRPLILYTSKVEDAEVWAERFRHSGLRRVATVTGKTGELERRSVMNRWRGLAPDGSAIEPSVDVIVGTSAFGLGLDMPNVRTIVHACLPETIDRYYQEVGRGGRYGKPSIAYLCSGPSDEKVAERLNAVTLIGDDRGWSRWERLLATGTKVTELRYRVRKSTLPVYLAEGFGESARWNVRTLTLMAQAGVIRFLVPEWSPDTAASEPENEKAREDFYRSVEDLIEFELLDGRYLGREGWVRALGGVRDQVRRSQQAALAAMKSLISGEQCVGRVIAGHYQVSHNGGVLRTQAACRGCPTCRRNPTICPGVTPVEPVPLLPWSGRASDPLAGWRGGRSELFIWHEKGADLMPLLVRFAQRNINVLSGIGTSEAARLQRGAVNSPIILDDPSAVVTLAETFAGPMVFVLETGELNTELRKRMRAGLVTYILGPESTANPDKPGALLRDTLDPSISAAALLESL